MRSQLRLSKPASRAAITAFSTCFQLWRRPMSLRMSLFALCTPRDMRLKPSRLSFASSRKTALSGFASSVTSASRSTVPEPLSSSKSSMSRSAP